MILLLVMDFPVLRVVYMDIIQDPQEKSIAYMRTSMDKSITYVPPSQESAAYFVHSAQIDQTKMKKKRAARVK